MRRHRACHRRDGAGGGAMSIDREPLREVGRRLRRSVVWAGAALALLLAGAAVGVMWSERHVATNARATGAGARGMPGTVPTGVGGGARGDEPFEVFLTPGAVERAGIKTAEVIAEARAD